MAKEFTFPLESNLNIDENRSTIPVGGYFEICAPSRICSEPPSLFPGVDKPCTKQQRWTTSEFNPLPLAGVPRLETEQTKPDRDLPPSACQSLTVSSQDGEPWVGHRHCRGWQFDIRILFGFQARGIAHQGTEGEFAKWQIAALKFALSTPHGRPVVCHIGHGI
jgi:hypothetical protein